MYHKSCRIPFSVSIMRHNYTKLYQRYFSIISRHFCPPIDIIKHSGHINTSQFRQLIIFEDNHLLIMYKPPQILVQGDITNDDNLLDAGKRYLVEEYKKKGRAYLGVVHRLDRPVSGVMVFAKTSKCVSRLCEQFRSHSVVKKYICVVHGVPAQRERVCVDELSRERKNGRVVVMREREGEGERERGKISSLSYEVLHSFHIPVKTNTTNHGVAEKLPSHITFPSSSSSSSSSSSLSEKREREGEKERSVLSISLFTGRKHQIRVQMRERGHPLLGDRRYGDMDRERERERKEGSERYRCTGKLEGVEWVWSGWLIL